MITKSWWSQDVFKTYFKTSFVRYGCLKNVSCFSWDSYMCVVKCWLVKFLFRSSSQLVYHFYAMHVLKYFLLSLFIFFNSAVLLFGLWGDVLIGLTCKKNKKSNCYKSKHSFSRVVLDIKLVVCCDDYYALIRPLSNDFTLHRSDLSYTSCTSRFALGFLKNFYDRSITLLECSLERAFVHRYTKD